MNANFMNDNFDIGKGVRARMLKIKAVFFDAGIMLSAVIVYLQSILVGGAFLLRGSLYWLCMMTLESLCCLGMITHCYPLWLFFVDSSEVRQK